MAKRSTTPASPAKPARKPARGSTNKTLRPGAAAGDDTTITALKLEPAALSPEMAAYFAKCEEKLGFVPNVLKAYAFDMPKLTAFVAMYNDLMLAPSGLSKLEREMIAVAVSSHNRCYYCLVAHGAAVRQLSGDPPLGELMAMNYRAARLSKRQRAMLDFAVKLTAEPWLVEEEDRERLRRSGFSEKEIWDIAAVAGFFNMTNRVASATDMRPNSVYHGQAR
ncbi:MAG: peroxidase-related enzyme [Xanthobacteraceae bacterium]